MHKGPFVIDPTKIGPFDRCLVCFTPKSDDYPYCMTCGRISGYHSILGDPQSGTACTFHPNVSATTFCVLCEKPICAGCIEREGFSLAGGFPAPQCRECIQGSEDLEKKYRKQLEHDKVCAKHSGEPAALGVSIANCLIAKAVSISPRLDGDERSLQLDRSV